MFGSLNNPAGSPRRRPEFAHIFFLLVVGVMVGLGVWSIGTSTKLRALPEEADIRSQLQAELRSLVKAPPLTTASQTTGTADRQPIPQDQGWMPSWTMIGLVMLIGSAFAVWAVINFYAAATEELDEDEVPSGQIPTTTHGRRSHGVPDWMKTAIRVGRDGVAAIEATGKITSANPVAEKLLGFETGRLPGRSAFELIPELGRSADDLRRFSQVTAPTLVKAKKRGGADVELQLALHRAGDGHFVAVFTAPEPVKPAVPVVAAAPAPSPETTQPKPAPVDAEALHGLENELVMLAGYSELLAAALPEGMQERLDAEAITRSAARAALLCHEVSPPVQPHGRSLHLNEFVMSTAPRIAVLLDPGCKVGGTIGSINAEVWADPELLERALGSLAWRAQEWTGGLQHVQVSNANGRLDLRMMPKTKGAPTTRAAFDRLPAIDWIEAQGASIEMEEHSEMGIRFRIWLPAAEAAKKRAPAAGKAAGGETVRKRGSHAAD